ncbi:MAG TPA: polysaccharide biosynthesis C-terminal domain-containing protein, partial [Cyclobacteriaceae bacterium]|nr:polysaccharide biosynthesis C-terminal domain-containing protein [Cyclobacteriaceae bacterium]
FSGAAYWSGLSVIPILLLGYLFLGIYYNLTVWFKLTDKTYFGTIIAVGGAVVTIVLNYLLIPIAGYMGSSIATLLCYFLMAASCYVIGQKYYPIPYKILAGLAYILGTTIIVYLVNAIVIDNQVIATAFHLVVIIIYLLIIYLVERKNLRQHVG